ncbi:Casp-like protein 4d1 [Thalictrum thalictroides]|uniref:CASP-like protein n=1 Tax=Thalictrum thalictroides TaxID=46969 RepID=A0A7J6VV98_THATH|nr:Casp-like protein 4d1 [Thalictrum thalictroides]
MATGSAIATLVLRLLALVLLAASIAIFATDKFTIDGQKATFRDIQAYKYVMAAALLVFIYTLIEIPFAIYHVLKEKRLINHGCVPHFESCADQIMAYILATAVGAGFGTTFEYKKVLKDFIEGLENLGFEGVEEAKSKGEKFLDRGNIATGVLFVAFICVAVQAVISSISRNNSATNSGRKGYWFG